MKAVLAFAVICLSTSTFGQAPDCDSMEKCQDSLKANPRSSLIRYRIGELYFAEEKLQASANEFRRALDGDLDPQWVEVWSRVNLGKVYDMSGQRERAVQQYRLAQKTGDNTRGALGEAANYIKEPFKKAN